MCTAFQYYKQLMLLIMLPFNLLAQNTAYFPVSNFQVNTTSGAPFSLYTPLEAQKIVILSFISTDANTYPNCWSYHISGALSELYEAHGPNGDQLVEIVLVEGDPETPNSNLSSWVTNYPKVNSNSLAQSFGITNFPANVVICPNKKGFKVPPLGAVALWEEARQCPVATGTHNVGLFETNWGTDAFDICVDINVKPTFKLINLGTEILNSCQIETLWGDEVINTETWTGNLALLQETAIEVDPVLLTQPGELKIRVSLPNNQDDLYPEENTRSKIFNEAPNIFNNNVALYLRTDSYGFETYWEIKNALNQVVESGGNTCVGPDGGGVPISYEPGCNAYQNNTTTLKYFFLPDGCYTFHIVDAFGDGICCTNGQGSFKLYNFVYNGSSPTITGSPIVGGGDFKTSESRGFSVGTLFNSVSPDSQSSAAISLSPNPTTDIIRINCDQAYDHLAVHNALGQPIALKTADPSAVLNTADWPSGWYQITLYQQNKRVGAQQFLKQSH
jgi:hypothetical protein